MDILLSIKQLNFKTKKINMIALVIMLFFLLRETAIYAGEREQELVRLVSIEINAIEKTNKRGEQLNYRLFELYSEKTKLLRKIENEKLLADQQQGKKIDKSSYYHESEQWMQNSLAFGKKIIKEFPKSRYLGAIYYGLASNQIEVKNNIENDQGSIIAWLQQSINVQGSEEKKYLALVKLAEVYYALKKFPLAISYYNKVLYNQQDRWHSKNLYNLAWCYFQIKDYNKAIQLALKSYAFSQRQQYEDMRDQVADAINYFYVFNKTPELAINFHTKYTKDLAERESHFVKILNLSKKFISSNVALQAEQSARSICQKQQDYSCLFELSFFKLEVFKENKNYEAHHDTVKNIVKEWLVLGNSDVELALKSKTDIKSKEKSNLADKNSSRSDVLARHSETLHQVINNIADLTSTFQQMVYKSYYVFHQDPQETFNRLIDYYNQLKILNPSFAHEYAYLQGELSYKERKWDLAGNYYYESLNKAPKPKQAFITSNNNGDSSKVAKNSNNQSEKNVASTNNDHNTSNANKTDNDLEQNNEFLEKLFKSMLALANDTHYKNNKFFEKVHLSYLDFYEKQENATVIYEALFKFYQAEKKYSDAEVLLERFARNLSSQINIQREMLKVVLNNHIISKNTVSFNEWIQKMQAGFLHMNSDFIKDNIKILAQLLFEKAQKLESSSQYLLAIEEYKKILANPLYPDEIKADSKFNLSVDFLQINDASASLDWLQQFIHERKADELDKKIATMQIMARQYVLIQSLPQASWLYFYLLSQKCSLIQNPDTTFLMLAQLDLTQNVTNFLSLIDDKSFFSSNVKVAKSCNFAHEIISSVRKLHLDWLWQQRAYRRLIDVLLTPSYQEHILSFADLYLKNFWSFLNPATDSEFALFNQQLQRLMHDGDKFLNDELKNRYAQLLMWQKEDASWNKEILAHNISSPLRDSLPNLQKKLDTQLQKLLDFKETKTTLVNQLKDASLYQANLLLLQRKFSYFVADLSRWQCSSEKKDDQTQWQQVKNQILKGLNDQIVSYQSALNDSLQKGAIPIGPLKNELTSNRYNSYLREGVSVEHQYLMYRLGVNSAMEGDAALHKNVTPTKNVAPKVAKPKVSPERGSASYE